MKLTNEQLRSLIESIVKEGTGSEQELDSAIQDVVRIAASIMQDEYLPHEAEYHARKAGTSMIGPDLWNEQVEVAAGVLEARLQKVIKQVKRSLHKGEFLD